MKTLRRILATGFAAAAIAAAGAIGSSPAQATCLYEHINWNQNQRGTVMISKGNVSYVGASMNDKTSSIAYVTRIHTYWEDANYRGHHLATAMAYNRLGSETKNLRSGNWNDRISSFA